MDSQYKTNYKNINNPFVKQCIQKFFDIMIPNGLSFIEWEDNLRRFAIMDDHPATRFYIIFDQKNDPTYVVDYDASIVKHFETNPLAIMHRDFYQRIDSLEQATAHTADNFKFDWADVGKSEGKSLQKLIDKLSLVPEKSQDLGDHYRPTAEMLLSEIRKSRGLDTKGWDSD